MAHARAMTKWEQHTAQRREYRSSHVIRHRERKHGDSAVGTPVLRERHLLPRALPTELRTSTATAPRSHY